MGGAKTFFAIDDGDNQTVVGFYSLSPASVEKLQEQGIGGQLLLAAEVGGVVLVIDAKNEKVAGWYASYGAVPLLDAPLSLVLPLATIEAALKKAGKLGS